MIRLIVLLASLMFSGVASAATLYVNNSGAPACSDATAKASNSAASPWCTIGRAVWGDDAYATPSTSEAAAAGDVVLISAGIYWESGSTTSDSYSRFRVALNPANSGTSGNPITFRGVGNVYVRLNDTVRGPMIGCDGTNYIVWDHFQIDDYYGGSAYDTGPVVFHSSTGCQLINSTVVGHPGSYYWGYATFVGNYNAIRLELADATLIKNNTLRQIHDHATGAGTVNQAGIMLYSSDDVIIEHNDISDTGTAISVKDNQASTQNDVHVRYNYVHDNDFVGIRLTGAVRTRVYQNVVKNTLEAAGQGIGISIGTDTVDAFILNNTLDGNDYGLVVALQVTTGTDKNNIVHGGTNAVWSPCGTTPSTWDAVFDRNLYYGYSGSFGRMDCDGNYTFATFQGTYSQDLNGINAQDPLFVATGTGAAYYKLQGGSPALTLGRVVESIGGTNGDTIPAGAYITGNEEIGIEATVVAAAVTIRFAPFNLRR